MWARHKGLLLLGAFYVMCRADRSCSQLWLGVQAAGLHLIKTFLQHIQLPQHCPMPSPSHTSRTSPTAAPKTPVPWGRLRHSPALCADREGCCTSWSVLLAARIAPDLAGAAGQPGRRIPLFPPAGTELFDVPLFTLGELQSQGPV